MADSSRRHDIDKSEADGCGPAKQPGILELRHSPTTQPPTQQSSTPTHKSRTQQLLAGLTKRKDLRLTEAAVISSVQRPSEEQAHSHSSDRSARPLKQIIGHYYKKVISKPKSLFKKTSASPTNLDTSVISTGSATRVLPASVPPPSRPLNSSDTDGSLVFDRKETPADASSNRSSHSTYDEPTSTPKEDAAASKHHIPPTERLSENEATTASKHHRTGSLTTQLIIDDGSLPELSISTGSTSPDLPDPSVQELRKDNDDGAPPLDIHAVIIYPGSTPNGKKNIKRRPAIVHLDTGCKIFDAVSGDFANTYELERKNSDKPMTAVLADGKSITVDQWVWLAIEATVNDKPEWMKFWVVEGAKSWSILFGEKTIREKNLLQKAKPDPRPRNFWILTGDGKDLSPEERQRDEQHNDTAHKLAEQNDADLQQADRELLYDPFTSTTQNGSGEAGSTGEGSYSQPTTEAGPGSTLNEASKG